MPKRGPRSERHLCGRHHALHCQEIRDQAAGTSDAGGKPYTDAVLTTRELVWMIKAYGIDFARLKEEDFDNPLGFSTGAGDIFGTTGGSWRPPCARPRKS